MAKGPVLIDLDGGAPDVGPADATPVFDDDSVAHADANGETSRAAMQQVAALAARRPSRLMRWFWSLALALLGFVASLAAYEYVAGLLVRSPVLGIAALVLVALLCAVLLLLALRELAAFSRLRRLDHLHKAAQIALAGDDLPAARRVVKGLEKLYGGRDDTRWGRARLAERQADIFDADGLLAVAEDTVLAPLDAQAMREVEAAARQVATITAIVPLALADLIVALTANLRMIRRVAEIYGGRSGTIGSWRLTRSVFTHLVATGAVAVGDDLIGSIAGGGVLSKVSRRFGEGVVNGALTARVGVAAIEVCRPLPFLNRSKPSVTGLVRRAMIGVFGNRT